MSWAGWHMIRDAQVLTVARHLPPRFDVAARAAFPDLRRGRLAHLIRQDLWRTLQALRGFSPVVRVAREGDGLHVTAGGRVAGAVPHDAPGRIAALLSDETYRARWIAQSRRFESTT